MGTINNHHRHRLFTTTVRSPLSIIGTWKWQRKADTPTKWNRISTATLAAWTMATFTLRLNQIFALNLLFLRHHRARKALQFKIKESILNHVQLTDLNYANLNCAQKVWAINSFWNALDTWIMLELDVVFDQIKWIAQIYRLFFFFFKKFSSSQ